MVTAKEISLFLDKYLDTTIEDGFYNGLQIENTGEVRKIGFAVDANLKTIEKCSNCDMLIVHHGLMYKGIRRIVNSNYLRIKSLIKNNIALYCSHLPLDVHKDVGNNVVLAKKLCLKNVEEFGIGVIGELDTTCSEVKDILGGENWFFGSENVSRIGIVTGSGTFMLDKIISEKIDLFITGDYAYWDKDIIIENKLNVLLMGHYESEVYGVQALMKIVQEKFNVEIEFIE